MRLSIIIPALNESGSIVSTLNALQEARQRGCEVILVDGGSHDKTCELSRPLVDRLITVGSGRAVQMNAGAAQAQAPVLWFLHADSQIPIHASESVLKAVEAGKEGWGYFAISLSGQHCLLRVIETAMNLRVRMTHVATGDHGIFVSRELFNRIGGFPAIALMEDVAISKLLRQHSHPVRVAEPIVTSSRRWESNGILRTMIKMWVLRLACFLGVSPQRLARFYRNHS